MYTEILSSVRDQRKKVRKQGRSPTSADILVDIKSFNFSLPMTKLGIKLPLVYLQV